MVVVVVEEGLYNPWADQGEILSICSAKSATTAPDRLGKSVEHARPGYGISPGLTSAALLRVFPSQLPRPRTHARTHTRLFETCREIKIKIKVKWTKCLKCLNPPRLKIALPPNVDLGSGYVMRNKEKKMASAPPFGYGPLFSSPLVSS